MTASFKNILIGIFVLTAIGIITFMLLFLHPTVGDNQKTLRVLFNDIDKVNVGTRVTFAGKPVGEVVSIQELSDVLNSRKGDNGEIYVYELILKVDSGVNVYNTDTISVRTSGLLGEKNVEITPLPLKPGQRLFLVEGETLYAISSGSVEDTLKQFSGLSQQFGLVLLDIHEAIQGLKQGQVFENLAYSMMNVREITQSLNQPEKIQQTLDNVVGLTQRAHMTWTTLDQAVVNFHQLSAQANHSWATVQNALQEFQATGANARLFTAQANQLISNTQQGKGTLGQLFVGDELYLRMKSVLHKGETILDDVKSYGILFQQDKRWQRLQARRLRLLEKLSSPYEFTNYFNEELNQISSSLSRVSMVLNESEYYPQSLLSDVDYSQRFAELLKRVGELEDSLKLYNEQVVSQE